MAHEAGVAYMSALNMVKLIEKKKTGQELSGLEIEAWIQGVTNGSVPDYQSAALLMAIRLKGMNFDETLALTNAMTHSGDSLQFSQKVLADKHSTGGIGDKVTIVLAPLMAACGVPVTMLSGRGLGFTGGTIDKFEALSGVSCEVDNVQMQAMIDRFGWANAQASERIAPADRVLYALRDVTGTVDSIPLITASILSKKLAGGASHLCLDVKCGQSAFMTDLKEARDLANNLKKIGTMGGLEIKCLITRMEEPLGHAVGNYLELLESVHYLGKNIDTPLMTLILTLGETMLTQTGLASGKTQAREMMKKALANGSALDKLRDYLSFTGARDQDIDLLFQQEFDQFPRRAIMANKAGYVSGVNGRGLGELLVGLGAGRRKHDDTIDPMAGVLLARHLGDTVEEGDVLAWVYGHQKEGSDLEEQMNHIYRVQSEPVPVPNIILDLI